MAEAQHIPQEDLSRIDPTEAPRAKRRPADRSSDWGSLVADLSSKHERPEWQIHDRTHLEFALDYPVDPSVRTTTYEWEAYFFIPESLRLDGKTYTKQDIYADLQSYVRFAVPSVDFSELSDEPVERIRQAATESVHAVMRELRLFACLVRAAGVRTRRAIVDALDEPETRSTALAASARMVADARRMVTRLRAALAELPPQEDDDTLATAARWVDEDVSRLLETLLGGLAVQLEKAGAPQSLYQLVVDAAVGEARYRAEKGLSGVGHRNTSKRQIEHLEFRRHVLKRFTSSVLWLKPEVREGARIVLEAFYALAAGLAMAFAVVATILNGEPIGERIWMWAAIAVLAYMGKDRMKAGLQKVFSKLVSRHFPDRRWRIRDRERGIVLGKLDEQSGFVDWKDLPEPVLAKRRTTRKHPLEEQARPEKVLWHKKLVRLSAERVAAADPRFDALTEIFRLDLRRWLAHTDDPKRKIVFADPEEGVVCSALAPRVYNIGIVYRLRRKDDPDAPWHRLRVVVSRKGIRRLEHIA